MLFKIPVSEHNRVSDKYLAGSSTLKLAKEYNVSWATICNILKKLKTKIRPLSQSHRKYALKEDFFDTIDSQEKAYFLGFLFADGCNSGHHISLNLSVKDKDMLDRLNILIHPEGKPLYKGHARISYLKNGKSASTKENYHLTIENKHISDVLSNYGCTPRKTNSLQFPQDIKEEFIPHFIRGYFDGDGSISLLGRNKRRNQAYISITSTRMFCKSVGDIIKQEGINSKIMEKNYAADNIVELRITAIQDILKFLPWIYKDSIIHLQRKYNRYMELINNRAIKKIKRVCIICGGAHYGKGYCSKHYQSYMIKIKALHKSEERLRTFVESSS